MTCEVDNLVRRVEKLERQNLQLKMLGLGIALGMAIFLLSGASSPPKTVEAEKVVIRDQHGRARITLGTPARAGLAVYESPDDPIIWLTDENGSDRGMLASDGLYFADRKAMPTVSLRSNGVPGLKLFGTDGRVFWSAP